ncbi:hypothetical protein FACS1894158_13960 [Betaproteobacteria bacterium]|nr:hypothetical protein FACS1894158_13960 [Betaproteobacteria bacterium]
MKREGVEGILRRLRSVSHEAPVVQEDNHGLIRPQVVLISHRQDGKYHFAGRPNEYVYTDTASHDLGDQYIDQRHINDNVIPSEQYCEWPKDVRTLRMPWFTSSSNIEIDNYTIGIFLHIFYTELARELVDAIKNIPWSVKVYVSTDTFEKKNIIASELEYAGFTDKYEIRILPNKGWDIAPFLIGFSDRIREHEIILRLHSKRSSHISEEKGTEWRSLLISSLVGSPERVQSILAAFVRCSNLGMVCTEHWHAILPFINAETDCGNMNRLLPLGYDIAINDPIDFPSGSMFWCRSKTLEPFLSKNFSWDDFAPTDERERWNTLAHAVERTFFFMCGFSGFQWSRVPQLEQSYKSDALLDGPWVSVILTSYNYAKYIGVSITSVLSQTWKSWELIIIDDGSTDASLDIIASFVAEDPRVSLLRHPDGGNHGLSASLQYAIQHAKHEIIAFLESDDFWCESYLEEHLKAMGKHKADATYCGVTCLAQPGAQQRLPSFRDYLSFCEENVPDKDKSFTLNATLRKRNVIPTMSCAVVKSSLLKNCNFDPPVAVWIDWWLWLQMDRAQFFYVDKKMTFWRVHAKSYHSKQEISEEETHALYALMRRQYDSLRI